MSEGQISPWMPETDPIRLAVYSKLTEECGELIGRVGRCIAQGIDELDPDKGETNGALLAKEMADVLACINTAELVLRLEISYDRRCSKEQGYERWHDMIRERAMPLFTINAGDITVEMRNEIEKAARNQIIRLEAEEAD